MRTVISFGFSIIEASVMLGIAGCVLSGRYSTYIKYILWGTAIFLGAVGINVIGGNDYFRSLVLITMFSIFCHILFCGPLQVKVFYLLFAQYICVVSEIILSSIIMFLPKYAINILLNNAVAETGISILVKLLVVAAGGVFVYYINKLNPRLPTKYWIVLDIILLIIIEALQTIMIMEAGLYKIKSIYLSYMVGTAYMVIFLGIFVIYFLGKICWIYEKKTEYELSQLRGTELEKIVSYQKQTANDMKKIRHDIKKHLSNILYMLELDQLAETKDYVINLTGVIETTKQDNFSGNYIIDVILNKHLAMCNNKRITLDLTVDDITNLNMSPVEVSAVLDNLLDNAAEAVDKLTGDKRWVSVKMFCFKDNFTAVIKNPYTGKIRMKNGTIYTNKLDWEKHGYGLKSAKDVVEKNCGVLKCYIEDTIFVAVFMVPLNGDFSIG